VASVGDGDRSETGWLKVERRVVRYVPDTRMAGMLRVLTKKWAGHMNIMAKKMAQ
jgi:hypothetical protein